MTAIFSLKMYQKRLAAGTRWGSSQRSPRPPSWFEGGRIAAGVGTEGRGGRGGREEEGRKGEEREGEREGQEWEWDGRTPQVSKQIDATGTIIVRSTNKYEPVDLVKL